MTAAPSENLSPTPTAPAAAVAVATAVPAVARPRPLLHLGNGLAAGVLGMILLVTAGDSPSVARSVFAIGALMLGIAEIAIALAAMLSHSAGDGDSADASPFRSIANVWTIMGREMRAYFTSPIAVLVFVIFHILAISLTFYGMLSGVAFWERGYADLELFFQVLPWLLLIFVPALSMRLWAEERQIGSIELLLTLPMRAGEILFGKFLGAWLIVSFMLLLPAVSLYVLLLRVGTPDTGQIVASFLGAVLMGGAYLALGSFLSSITKDQIVAFILTVLASAAFAFISAEPVVQTLAGIGASERVWEDGRLVATEGVGSYLALVAQKISLSARFNSIGRGVLDVADLLYYACFIGFFLYLNSVMLAVKR